MVNIQTLQEFNELARSLSFTKTAQTFFITQSALSKHILALEAEFNATLFDRTCYGVQLTEAGRLLFEKSVTIVELYQDAHSELQTIKSLPSITIGGDIDDTDIAPLLSMTATVMRNTNGRNMVFSVNKRTDLINMVLDNKIDVCVSFKPKEKVEEAGLTYKSLFSLPLVAIMSVNHPLAMRESVSISDLRDQVFLKFESDKTDASFDQILSICHTHGFSPKLKHVNYSNHIEFFSTPLTGSILIWKSTERDMGFQMETKHRALVPIIDVDARLYVGAAYLSNNESNLTQFFDSLKTSLTLLDRRRNK
ncbi:MAG: LysR family transcriptional regulator [Coriobacteriales bacterium]|jgi:DNA-binding transcriptional LysR family regulator|nr:LysR family transcriptional regulator [Coriobacteriales bacterium]